MFEMVRMIATARIIMPQSMVRLSAGRVRFSTAEQAMCFMAGANSIFTGDKLLTTPNNEFTDDQKMFDLLGKLISCWCPMKMSLSLLQVLCLNPPISSKARTRLNSPSTRTASRSRPRLKHKSVVFMYNRVVLCMFYI